MGNNKSYIALGVLTVGLAMFVCWMLDPAMFWSICKWSFGGLLIVCILCAIGDHDDREPYQKDGPGSFYHNSQKKQWKKGGN